MLRHGMKRPPSTGAPQKIADRMIRLLLLSSMGLFLGSKLKRQRKVSCSGACRRSPFRLFPFSTCKSAPVMFSSCLRTTSETALTMPRVSLDWRRKDPWRWMGGGEESVENAFGNDGHGCRQRPEKIRATRDPAAAVVHIVASCCTLHFMPVHATCIHMP